MADTILRGISATGGIRIFVTETTEVVRRAQQIHKTYPIATAALGRLLTAGAMMGSMMKNEKDKNNRNAHGMLPRLDGKVRKSHRACVRCG